MTQITLLSLALLGCLAISVQAEILNPDPKGPPSRKDGKGPEHGDVDDEGHELVEGDIVPGVREKGDKKGGSDRNAIVDKALFWPKDSRGLVTIPYILDASITNSAAHKKAFLDAVADYKKFTCVNWVPRSNERNYVRVFTGRGCYSYVGTQNRGSQDLSLGWGCQYKGIAIHEMMHATGFDHEQTRDDRDNYVTIHWQNIQKGQEHNFQKCGTKRGGCTSQGYSYDYDSIMHYETYAFQKQGAGDTITPNRGGVKIGQRYGFSSQDAKRINVLYQCGNLKVGGGGGGGGGGGAVDKDSNCPGWRTYCNSNNYVKTNCLKTCSG